MTERKLRVAVVFGGRSTEHTITCLSAGSVLSQLDRDRFDVVPVGITVDGAWVLTSSAPAAITAGEPVAELSVSSDLVATPPDRVGDVLGGIDVVFPVLHGAYGEDGTIQGLLELAGIPYVGANVFASAAAMDKEFAKKLTAAAGIPMGDYVVLRAGQSLSPADQDRLGLPVFVKPARGGSSFGITKVSDWADLDAAVATAR